MRFSLRAVPRRSVHIGHGSVYSPPVSIRVVPLPHSPEEKKRAITRLRRIRGQVDGLERAIAAGTDCGPVLQQIAALRGAVNGLMADILDGHLHEEFTQVAVDPKIRKQHQASIEQVIALVRSYLK
jgi:DNA-binding FrmR family transcriptional regulator